MDKLPINHRAHGAHRELTQKIVELKSVAQLDRVHESQMLSYLKLSGFPIGLLIDFDVPRLSDGIRRLAGPANQ